MRESRLYTAAVLAVVGFALYLFLQRLPTATTGLRTATPTPSSAESPGPARPAASAGQPIAFSCEARRLPFSGEVDLTGAWLGNDDGIYYMRQVGNALWWSGMHLRGTDEATLGRLFTIVFHGTINRSNMTISGDHIDVPRGENSGGSTLVFEIVDDGGTVIQLVEERALDGVVMLGNFGATTLTPCQEARLIP
jgi:hypothetical protein